MPFTSPFGGLGLTTFNPASPNLPQNLAAKPKAAPEALVPTKPTVPAGAETITALVRPSMIQPARATAPVPETPAFASMPEPAMPGAIAPAPPLPSFASAPSPYALAQPTMPGLPMAARRLNPNRLIFV